MKDEINEQINYAYEDLDKLQRVQEQVEILNKGLNSCIDIVNSSISNSQIAEQLNQLGTDNLAAYKETKNNIEENYEDTKNKIYRLQEEKRELEEQEEEEKKEKEKNK